MLRSLSLIVSGSFLFAGVAFAEDEEKAAPATEAAPAEAAPATEAAPAKGPAAKRAVGPPGMKKMMPQRPTAKADPEAAKKMDECRNKCLTDKSTGDDRLKCFFACRMGIRGFVPPYAGFKPCAEASRACRKDKCKWSPQPFSPAAGGKGPMVTRGGPGPKRPMVGNRPGPGPQGRPGPAIAGRPGQRPGPGPGHRPGPAAGGVHRHAHAKGGVSGTPVRPRMSDEMRKCMQECGKAYRACLTDVLAKATPAGGAAPAATTTTTETKPDDKPAATTEKPTETPTETKPEDKPAEEKPAEESTEGGSETP